MALTTVINTADAVAEGAATIIPVATPTTLVVDGLASKELCTVLVETVGGYKPLRVRGRSVVKLTNLINTILLNAPGNYKVTKEITIGAVTVGYTA